MNSKSKEAQRLLDHLHEGESTYGDVDDLGRLLSGHAATLAPAVLERIAALTTATDHGWNFVTGEEYSDSIDCAPVARRARVELARRRARTPDVRRAETQGARRRSEFAALARSPRPAHLPRLVAGLSDADLDVRVRAAKALGKLGDRKAVAALARAMKSPDPELREAAAVALGRLGGPRACAALRPCLCDETDTVAAKVADALGALRDPRAIEPLLKLVGHTWTEYAEPHALRALKEIGARAIPAVRRAVLTQRYERAYLIPLLAELDPRGSVGVLGGLLKAPDQGTVEAAAEALGKIGGKRAVAALEATVAGMPANGRIPRVLRRALARARRRLAR